MTSVDKNQVAATYFLEVAAQGPDRCGEAPIWDASRGRLVWTDIESAVVYALDPSTGEKKVLSRKLPVSGIALNKGGELIFAGATGLHLWRAQDDFRTVVSKQDEEALAFNDIIADAQGRIYAGTLSWGPEGMEKLGKLYLLGTGGTAQVVDDGIELANGLGFSPGDETLYFTDSAARKIYAYDVDRVTGALSRKRVFVSVPGNEGIPDGLTVDRAGFLWSAQWYGSQVVRYDPDGKVERRIAMPVEQVSSVAFGGPDLTDLYITSAAESWRSALAPPGYDFEDSDREDDDREAGGHEGSGHGGALYRLRLEIQGKPEHLAALRWQ